MGFSSSGGAKVGTIELWGGSTAPDGYLLCNGGIVSRTLYSDLFKVIGTTYGSGDGSTTFNLPNSSNLVTNVNTDVTVRGTGGSLGLYGYDSGGTKGTLFTAAANGNIADLNAHFESSIGSNVSLGVINNDAQSGLTGTVTRTVLTCKHIIKY